MNDYLSVNELSQYINLSSSAIYKKTSARLIPFTKSGKKLLFKKVAIDEWLEQHAQETLSEMQKKIIDLLKPSRNKD